MVAGVESPFDANIKSGVSAGPALSLDDAFPAFPPPFPAFSPPFLLLTFDEDINSAVLIDMSSCCCWV